MKAISFGHEKYSVSVHAPQDTIERIQKDYLDSYHLMAAYLVYLDQYLDAPPQSEHASKEPVPQP